MDYFLSVVNSREPVLLYGFVESEIAFYGLIGFAGGELCGELEIQ